MSTGMISLDELKESVQTLAENGCPEIVLLKCTSTYPASAENSNLLTIPDKQKQFPDCVIGLSDHTLGTAVSVASVALGAKVIEKHFTLSRAEGGVDSTFSMEPAEMCQLIADADNAYKSLGEVFYGATESEISSLKYRRSLYVVKDIMKDELFTEDNVRSIRPGYGISPKYLSDVLGKKAVKNILRGEPLSKIMVDILRSK
jgi:N-acetylneuraminate synthase